jgi:phosphate transport system substrate-binding protein
VTLTTRRTGVLAAALFAVAACGATGSTSSPSGSAGTAGAASGSAESQAPAGSEAPSGSQRTGGLPATGGSPARDLTGEINISGSSTVQPITQGMADLFNEQNPEVAIRVDGPGTGDGFKVFCTGETDISDASRKIKDEEKKACADNGVEYIEIQVAIDGMSVLTSSKNSTLTCLSYADLYALVGPESEGFDNWKDAQSVATELGSKTQLPDAPLEISGPGEESGTYDYFVEAVITPFAKERGKDEQTRKDYNSNPNDNVIIQGIEGTDTSLGWVGYAYAREAGDQVKLLEVSKPDGECVAPTPETIASNEYPLSRPLFIYVNKAEAAENQALAAFVDFYLVEDDLKSVNAETGYVSLEGAELEKQRSAWQGR